MARFTAEQILRELDADAAPERLEFPMLDNGYVYPADVRLLAFRDEKRWAILIEDLGYHYKSGFPDGINSTFYTVGSGVTERGVYLDGAQTLTGEPSGEEDWEYEVAADLKEVVIRGERVPVPRRKAVYQKKGIKIGSPRKLCGQHLLRVLLPEHRDALLASEEEWRRYVRPDLPFFLWLDEWDHPDLAEGQLPSQTHTFPALAEALEQGDPNRFVPTTRPNTHWKNWPHGGAM